MAEECGIFALSRNVLYRGLAACPGNEQLMVKTIKTEERRGNVAAARHLLARACFDTNWRPLLEGALMEARAGNDAVARGALRFLADGPAASGPIIHEACGFEERRGRLAAALALARRGLKSVSRFGPLWFATVRMLEALESASEECECWCLRGRERVDPRDGCPCVCVRARAGASGCVRARADASGCVRARAGASECVRARAGASGCVWARADASGCVRARAGGSEGRLPLRVCARLRAHSGPPVCVLRRCTTEPAAHPRRC